MYALDTRALRRAMSERKIGPKGLSYALGCTDRAVNNYLHGRRQPNADMLTRMCVALDMPLLSLMRRSTDELHH